MAEKYNDLINVADYPKTAYSAYWEIGINRWTNEWVAKIMDRQTSKVHAAMSAGAPDMQAARTASQTWVKQQMEQYKRLS